MTVVMGEMLFSGRHDSFASHTPVWRAVYIALLNSSGLEHGIDRVRAVEMLHLTRFRTWSGEC
jgi:hypothetical protein